MNEKILIIILILFVGVILFSFLGFGLGIECERMETMQNTDKSNTNVSHRDSHYMNSVPSGAKISYDNYNHYKKSATQLANGTSFYGENGGLIVVNTNSDGSQTLTVTLASGDTPVVYTNTEPTTSSKVETYTNYQMQNTNGGAANIFYGPTGNTASIFTDANGQTAVRVKTTTGTYLFTSSGTNVYHTNAAPTNTISSTQYYGSTGTPIQTSTNTLAYTGPQGNTAYYASGPAGNAVVGTTSANPYYSDINAGAATGPQGNTAYYATGPGGNTVAGTTNNPNYYTSSASAGAVTGPQGNTAYYATGPGGNTVAGTTTTTNSCYDYSSSLPQGIPKSAIPPGQEDMYILKTEVVPPVCPICLSGANSGENKKCPPCPACARCPEPSITCKAVPNYNTINDQYLPQPVLNDFSTFGM